MQDLNKIWTSCVDTLEKQNIVEDKIMLDSLFRPATLEAIEDNKVTITTDLQWNIDPILEKQSEIESILSNSFSIISFLPFPLSSRSSHSYLTSL